MMLSKQAIAALLLTSLSCAPVGAFWNRETQEVEEKKERMGVDESWPMHYSEWHPLSPERKRDYEVFMQGCRDHYGDKGHLCDSNEEDRIEMTLRQPQSMVNYTETGFMKIQAPESLRQLLTQHWEMNKDEQAKENWPKANIYTNHWAAETRMVSVEDSNLAGGGYHLKDKVWAAARDTIEKWTGMELQPTSLYGIRVYTEGAILSPHVDRLPLVSSCIVNVAQDVDEPWPLEVIDRQGNAVNVTMEPGDMVLYESHSLIHGRPFPLKGRFFANIFIHFEPTGRHVYHRSDDPEKEIMNNLAPYILPGSPEEENWRKRNPHGWRQPSPSSANADNKPETHAAAQKGDIDALAKIAAKNARLLQSKDQNGWQPIHEAARSGHKETVELLLKHGVDMNARTWQDKGSSPLNLAIKTHGEDHPVSKYLQSLGALNIEPEL
jgi:hypothetical protein